MTLNDLIKCAPLTKKCVPPHHMSIPSPINQSITNNRQSLMILHVQFIESFNTTSVAKTAAKPRNWATGCHGLLNHCQYNVISIDLLTEIGLLQTRTPLFWMCLPSGLVILKQATLFNTEIDFHIGAAHASINSWVI